MRSHFQELIHTCDRRNFMGFSWGCFFNGLSVIIYPIITKWNETSHSGVFSPPPSIRWTNRDFIGSCSNPLTFTDYLIFRMGDPCLCVIKCSNFWINLYMKRLRWFVIFLPMVDSLEITIVSEVFTKSFRQIFLNS